MDSVKRPDLSKEPLVSIDTETHDPDLLEKGSGAFTNNGKIVGFSVGTRSGFSEYYNVGHPGVSSEEATKNYRYLEDICSLPSPKVGANLFYDIGWIQVWKGIKVLGSIYDVLTAEPLLDEYTRGKNNLNGLANKYLGESKQNNELLDYCAKMGWSTNKKKGGREHIYKMPYEVVRSYGKADADQPIRIWDCQEPLLQEQELWELYKIEAGLFPILLKMKINGVRINEDGLTRLGMKVSDEIYNRHKHLSDHVGFQLNVNSNTDMKKIFDRNGWEYPRNAPTAIMKKQGKTVGNPCFNKKALKTMDYPFVKDVLELRHLMTMNSFFIEPYPRLMTDGRLRANFNPLGGDKDGTKSGRFASTNPNLQQVTSKDEENEITIPGFEGQIIRKLFIPEEGYDWFKIDWSQIEYRIIAHYGIGAGSELIRKRYTDNPYTDYHQELMNMTGIDQRKIIKTLNFGAAYEMGPKTMANDYGWDMDYAKNVYKMYHNKVPFLKHTSKLVAKKAERVGYIKTILGRRARLEYADKSYVMFNRLIQGSAADLMKLAMVQSYDAGIYDTLIPHITVHDEIDCSKPKTKEGDEAGRELKRIMEQCIELKVPIIADAEVGPNWGTLKDFV